MASGAGGAAGRHGRDVVPATQLDEEEELFVRDEENGSNNGTQLLLPAHVSAEALQKIIDLIAGESVEMPNANGTTRTIQPMDREQARKRRYEPSLEDNVKELVWDDMKSMEHSCRVIYLLNLQVLERQQLVDFYLGGYGGPKVDQLKKHGYNRIIGNAKNWKSSSLINFKAYLRKLKKDDEVFHAEKNRTSLQLQLKRQFSVRLFQEIFKWSKGLDLEASGPKAKTWCKLIFCDIGSVLKLNVDWEDDPNSLKEFDWDNEAVWNRWFTICSNSKWADMKPAPRDIQAVTRREKPGKAAKPSRQFINPEEDEYLFIG